MNGAASLLYLAILSVATSCERPAREKPNQALGLFSIQSEREFIASGEHGIDTARSGMKSQGLSIAVEYALTFDLANVPSAEEALHDLAGAWESSGYEPDFKLIDKYGVLSQQRNDGDPNGLPRYTYISFFPDAVIHIYHDASVKNIEIAELLKAITLHRKPLFEDPFSPNPASEPG